MHPTALRSPRRLAAALFVFSLGLGAVPAATAGAQSAVPPSGCPATLPVDDVRKGMVGTGWTVSSGRQPEPFSVEVLGVMRDQIAPGRHLIVIDASGPSIAAAGGIWYGMSGSPVYVEDKLLGAVAYGMSSTSTVAGVTPAEDMMRLLDYPASSVGSAPRRVTLSAGMQETIATETDASIAEVDNSLDRLRLPFSVSGVTGRGMRRVKSVISQERLDLIAYRGASGSSEPSPGPGGVGPGDNFAAALSYGDITMAGVGTTTFVCDQRAVAFGHPFFFDGRTTMGANAADALTVVRDPLWGPYKLATLGESVGVVDQDRLAGIRADLTRVPTTTPITSSVTALDTGMSRDGRTEAVISRVVPFLAFIHMFTNIDATFDQISGGSADVSWTISGVTASGTTWTLTRSNKFVSRYDISFGSLFELLDHLYAIYYNKFEDVEFTGVDVTASVEEQIRRYKVIDVRVSKNGTRFRDVDRVRAEPGSRIYLRAILEPYDATRNRKVDLEVSVPETARRDAVIEVGGPGGEDDDLCFYDDGCGDGSGKKVDSFEKLVGALEDQPKNNELRARLRLEGRRRVRSQDLEVLDQVVTGRKRIRVVLGGDSTSEPKEVP